MYATYRQWSQGDEYLDFEGEEQRQGQLVFPSLSHCVSQEHMMVLMQRELHSLIQRMMPTLSTINHSISES